MEFVDLVSTQLFVCLNFVILSEDKKILERITGDQKKTEKIASLFAAFFWIIILFGFVTFFMGNPFAVFFG